MLNKELINYFPGVPKVTGTISVTYKRQINRATVKNIENQITEFLEEVSVLGINNFVVGLSGGLDSAVACALIQSAMGAKATAIIIEMDNPEAYSADTEFSIMLARKIGITYEIINASKLYQEHLSVIKNNSTLARVHLRSRLINNIIFQYADNQMAMVVDTTDKSEDILKIYEESFRGHVAPLLGFYKSELLHIADYFSLNELKEKNSGCPELVDIDAFGAKWDVLDPLLHLLAERGVSCSEIAKNYSMDQEWLEALSKRITTQPLRTKTRRIDIATARS